MNKTLKLSMITTLALASSAFAASDLASAFKEGTTSGYVRAMYLNTMKKDVADTTSMAVGGKVEYVTGSLSGFKAGASFFTSNPIFSGNADKEDGTLYNGVDKKGYNVLGEAYIQYDMGKTTVKVGRQQLDTPLAGSET